MTIWSRPNTPEYEENYYRIFGPMKDQTMTPMRILVACECSGAVRDAFNDLGHEAWSYDLKPSENPGRHVQRDVTEVLDGNWDMLIAFPPCTHLASSGARWFKDKEEEQKQAIAFFMRFVNAPIKRICIENPVGIMSTRYRKPNQIIQPWQFGHNESKATCLWLKNLEPLRPTHVLEKPASGRWANQTPSGQNKLGPSPTRAADRSRTYAGIAQAMANQWG